MRMAPLSEEASHSLLSSGLKCRSSSGNARAEVSCKLWATDAYPMMKVLWQVRCNRLAAGEAPLGGQELPARRDAARPRDREALREFAWSPSAS